MKGNGIPVGRVENTMIMGNTHYKTNLALMAAKEIRLTDRENTIKKKICVSNLFYCFLDIS